MYLWIRRNANSLAHPALLPIVFVIAVIAFAPPLIELVVGPNDAAAGDPTVEQLERENDRLRRELAATNDAYQDALDRVEDARPLVRLQVRKWRDELGLSWTYIKTQPAWHAYRGPLLGT
jgi:hypothetical protein